MSNHPILRAGTLALAFALTTPAFAQTLNTSEDLLTGDSRLACEAILCLSTSQRPNECSPALKRYFSIKKYKKRILDWKATVNARRDFLAICPTGNEPGMPERLDAIARGAGKCDPDYLNSVFAGTAYQWRHRRRYPSAFATDDKDRYEVHKIKTVTQNKLPAYCTIYNDHEWTYKLSVKYVGEPVKGGYWVQAEDYSAEQAKWSAQYSGAWASKWNFSLTDPRKSRDSSNNR